MRRTEEMHLDFLDLMHKHGAGPHRPGYIVMKPGKNNEPDLQPVVLPGLASQSSGGQSRLSPTQEQTLLDALMKWFGSRIRGGQGARQASLEGYSATDMQ